MLFDGLIVTVSKKMARVGTSSMHNEFIAQAECIKTLLYVRNMATSWGCPEFCQTFPTDDHIGSTVMQGDNRTITEQLRENRITKQNRFYLSNYHFVREIYADGHVLLTWIMGSTNGPNIYTKAVGRQILNPLQLVETGYSPGPLPPPKISLTLVEAIKFGSKL